MKKLPAVILLLWPACAALAGEEASESKWVVFGRVTDCDARGLAGVSVVAHCGSGTLRPTGETATDAEGKYRLEFGPGLLISGGVGLQAAVISPRKKGFFEKNLHRQGDLQMADTLPEAGQEGSVRLGRVVVRGSPFRLDFVMLPAASIDLEIVDEENRPLPGARVWVDGDELPPASSVLFDTKTADDAGKLLLEGVPTRFAWRIHLGDEYFATVTIPSPSAHRLRLGRAIHPKGGWWMLLAVSYSSRGCDQTLVVAVQEEPPWTGSHGLECRLRADYLTWEPGEFPVLTMEARDGSGQGDRVLSFGSWQLEVDGTTFLRRDGKEPLRELKQGETSPRCSVRLDAGWMDEGGRHLSLGQGRHTVRLLARAVHPKGSAGVISNRVTIVVTD